MDTETERLRIRPLAPADGEAGFVATAPGGEHGIPLRDELELARTLRGVTRR